MQGRRSVIQDPAGERGGELTEGEAGEGDFGGGLRELPPPRAASDPPCASSDPHPASTFIESARFICWRSLAQ